MKAARAVYIGSGVRDRARRPKWSLVALDLAIVTTTPSGSGEIYDQTHAVARGGVRPP
jgi:hypothetical protein